MKVDKIVTPVVEKMSNNGANRLKSVTANSIKEFNDKTGEITGRTKVLIDSARKITAAELAKIKTELQQKMEERGFAPSVMDYILSYTDYHSWRAAKAMVEDPYAHTSQIKWAIGYTTPANARLMEDAAIKKNYEAFYRIKGGQITSTSQIEDKSIQVMAEGRIYNPKKVNTVAVSKEVLEAEKQEILNLAKAKGAKQNDLNYLKSYINTENVEVAKVLGEDPEVSIGFMKWVVPYTNSENAELILRAALHKDYNAVNLIPGGTIREFSTLDARYAYRKRFGQKDFYSADDPWLFIKDETSDASRILFEDSFYDYDIIKKIIGKINKNNIKEFREALLNRDIEAIERLCGKKLNSRELDFLKQEAAKKPEFKTTSSTGKISRADFVNYMEGKLISIRKLDTAILKDSEVRNLAKLFGITEEQVLNMDKKTYRRLCIKFHPDRNPDDALSTQVFRILNRIFLG